VDLAEFEYSGIKIQGYSEGGVRTSIIWPNLDLAIDMGNTYPGQTRYKNLLLTHSHLDHFSGVPYYISQRSLQRLEPPNIYFPKEIHKDLVELFKIYSRLEDFEYKLNLIPLEFGETIVLNKQYSFAAHKTFHRVPSQGYTIYETKNKLKLEYNNMSQAEILLLKEKGIEISQSMIQPVFSFSGDTKIEYILEHEDVRKSKVLFLECTYIDSTKDVEHARLWGHTHLFEIAEHADQFENEKLVLLHFSPRYSYKFIREQIQKILPKHLHERVEFFFPKKASFKK
jgi:ribonuclease Z